MAQGAEVRSSIVRQRWIRRYRTLRSLTRVQWRSAATASVQLPIVAISLRRHGYSHVNSRLIGRRPIGLVLDPAADVEPQLQIATAREIAAAVRVAARYMPDATCLRQSIVLRELLARRGIDSEICFGVRAAQTTEAGQPYDFHAWVVAHDQVVSESPARIVSFSQLSDPRLLGPGFGD